MQLPKDMQTWAEQNAGRLFCYLTYKRLFTPYEQKQAFMDESQFDDTYYNLGTLEELVPLGSGDWLLGFRDVIDGEAAHSISYRRLSEIQLSYYENDEMEED